MCVSAVVETELQKLAARLGLERLTPFGDEREPPRRVEARAEAWVIHAGSAARLVAERMVFKPYGLRRRHIGGDMWASSLLSANHGLIVLKSFSEWVSADLLLGQGLIGVHDANCAFTKATGGPMGRLLLANFTAPTPLLVPVLFDARQPREAGLAAREFVLIADDPPPVLRGFGLPSAPLCLSRDLALEWLHPEGELGPPLSADDAEPFAVDFEEVLEDGRTEVFAFSLFKSA